MAKKHPKFDTASETDRVVRDLGNRKKLTPHDLCSFKGENPRQDQFIQAYLSNIKMISMTGPPGTGKTFLALGMALLEVLDDSTEFDKVIIVRSAVESRKQGFLPGSQDEKNEPFEIPYVQACKDLFPKLNNGYAHAKSLGHVEFHTTGHFRGQNLDRCVLLVDESENLDWGELYTLISRLGPNSRVVLMGDHKQSDLYRYREKSGLPRLEKVMLNMPYHSTATVEFQLDDIVRSGLVKDFVIADYELDD